MSSDKAAGPIQWVSAYNLDHEPAQRFVADCSGLLSGEVIRAVSCRTAPGRLTTGRLCGDAIDHPVQAPFHPAPQGPQVRMRINAPHPTCPPHPAEPQATNGPTR